MFKIVYIGFPRAELCIKPSCPQINQVPGFQASPYLVFKGSRGDVVILFKWHWYCNCPQNFPCGAICSTALTRVHKCTSYRQEQIRILLVSCGANLFLLLPADCFSFHHPAWKRCFFCCPECLLVCLYSWINCASKQYIDLFTARIQYRPTPPPPRDQSAAKSP